MEVELQRVYRHFKGNYYFVREIVICSETSKKYILYQALYGDCKAYIRPLEMFIEEIDINREGNITGQNVRFKLVDKII